jgi:hypothetical protein
LRLRCASKSAASSPGFPRLSFAAKTIPHRVWSDLPSGRCFPLSGLAVLGGAVGVGLGFGMIPLRHEDILISPGSTLQVEMVRAKKSPKDD